MTAAETLYTRLTSVVGEQRVRMDECRTAAWAIASCHPSLVVYPDTVAQAAEVLALAGQERLAVVPWGQGTQMHLGKAPQRYDLALSLAHLGQIIDYDVANLTLVAQAGVALRDVYQLSVPERQFLPLGFPGTRASLGGLLVTNTSGVKRARYGALRDLLLGVRVALPDGALVRFGGRVVKNVAGYDMNKLFIGSLGVFGMVLETTYRLAALPEDDQGLYGVFPSVQQAMAAAAAVQGSQLQPSALLLLEANAAAMCPVASRQPLQAPQVALFVNFDGMYEAVERQIRESQAICQQHGGLAATGLAGEALLEFWEFQETWRAAPLAADQAQLRVRLGMHIGDAQDGIACLSKSQVFDRHGIAWVMDYSHSHLWAHLPLPHPGAGDRPQAIATWLQSLRAQLGDRQGYCMIEYAPAELRQQLDVWGETPGQQVLRLYKQRFDPHAVLNPGRYAAGL